ncbi:acyltransferase family protein [Roseovarius phycicola]|uniref:Acyltransferase family protein n=1 Tax=Roseovarius phycicola TaxID=3080976 RepID=A0ABZ2HC15_9RHOB
MQYRREIDGLRAVAVLPVILFHAGVSVFSGGFVGVDVFFVISGYLITTILISEREAGTYSIWSFYERRARRILPALFLVLIATMPFAWFWIAPDPFEDYARSFAFAALFISNVHFLEHSGYFDVSSELRPLLHTWSLAVEEQYYLLFPVVLWACGAFVRAKFLWVFLMLSVLSLSLAEWGWRNFPTQNFFFSPSRLWELLAGSICAVLLYARPQMRHDLLGLLGLGLILASVFVYDERVPFPSVYTLVPVVGTMLIILFASQGTWAARLLAWGPMVGIGLISYSAYLWHQPIFAFARIRVVGEPSALLMAGGVVLSLVLAYLSWRFVERPFRTRAWLPARGGLFAVCLTGIAASGVFGAWTAQTEGFSSRLEGRGDDRYFAALDRRLDTRPKDSCSNPEDMKNGVLCAVFAPHASDVSWALLGDSHAQAILPALEAVSDAEGVSILRGIRPGCPPLMGVHLVYAGREAELCFKSTQSLAEQVVASGADTVILAARWSLFAPGDLSRAERSFMVSESPQNRAQTDAAWRASYTVGVHNMIRFYRDAGLRVILLRQVPQQLQLPNNVIAQALLKNLPAAQVEAEIAHSFIPIQTHRDLVEFSETVLIEAAKEHGAQVVSVNDFFEEAETYAWFRDGVLYYKDADHLSLQGALALGPLLAERLRTRR